MKIISYLCFVGLFSINQALHATCASLVRGPMTVDIQTCNVVNPEQALGSHEPKYNFIKSLPPVQRKAFLDSYRGLIVKAKIAYSLAVRSGFSREQGALTGEIINAFIPPEVLSCQAIEGKRLEVSADEECCEGGGQVPCLLSSTIILKNPAVIGGANSKAGHKDSHKAAHPDYKQAKVLFGQRDYKGASQLLIKLNQSEQLDVQGIFLLATAYRELDKCPAAIPLLEGLYQKTVKNDFWSDEEIYIRRGNFLYARCLSMMQRSDEAVMILQSFLVEPKKYSKEIKQSLNHRDFGYIRTSKSFVDYRDVARKVLAQP